jgi:hypothetical protein
VLALAVAGCEIIGGIEPFTPATAPADGGGDDAAIPDPGSARDGAPPAPPEGGADATEAPDVLAPRYYCSNFAPPPLLCADFDGTPALETGWTTTFVNTRGRAERTAKMFRSEPFAFLSHTDGNAGGGVDAKLIRAYPQTAVKIELAFDLNLPSSCAPVTTDAFFVLASIEPLVGSHHVNLLLRPEATFVEEYVPVDGGGGEFETTQLSSGIPYGKWTRIVLTLDFRGGTIALTYDGVAQIPLTPLHPARGAGRASIGLGGNGNLPNCDAVYDNVVLDARE